MTRPVPYLPDAAAALVWLRERGARSLVADSRRVQAGDVFVAWPGHVQDGRAYVPAALAAGAAGCLVEAEGVEAFQFDGEQVAAVPHLKALTGVIASEWFERPSTQLDVVAVTGTNGKTSVSWWVAQGLSLLGRRCGVVGTLGVGEPPSATAAQAQITSTGLTSPDPIVLQSAFQRFVTQGFAACAIEASSIGIAEHRLAGVQVAVALFTNLTRDHLDYHGSMEAYWEAKARLFAWPGLRAAVLNLDDEHGAIAAQSLAGQALDLWTYSTRGPARLQAADIAYVDGGLAFTLIEADHRVDVRSRLIGDYNVSNLLAVVGGWRALGVSLDDIAALCPRLTAVPGRMQRVIPAARTGEPLPAGPAVIVDYAHTPDALDKALQALRPFAKERGGVLWGVFGCGGNRDATKRPLMGALAERLADHVVITSDNPRHELPAEILKHIAAGMARPDRAQVIEDRRAAISQAVRSAGADDVVLIAGKGHEAEQEIAGIKHPFSDVAEAQAALAGWMDEGSRP